VCNQIFNWSDVIEVVGAWLQEQEVRFSMGKRLGFVSGWRDALEIPEWIQACFVEVELR
jgi:hypothetical protein